MSSRNDRPYCRVYWGIPDDPKFAAVWGDDRALACWLRLLILADQAWPASAPVPAAERKAALQALVDAGLVDVQPGNRYRVHGLDAEREARQEHGRNAAAVRWDARRDARALLVHHVGNADPMPSRAEPSRAKPSRAEQSIARGADGGQADQRRDPADDFWTVTGRYPNERARKWIDEMAAEHGASAVTAAIASCHQSDPSPAHLLSRVRDALARGSRKSELAEADRGREAVEARRAARRPKSFPEELAERKALLELSAQMFGGKDS